MTDTPKDPADFTPSDYRRAVIALQHAQDVQQRMLAWLDEEITRRRMQPAYTDYEYARYEGAADALEDARDELRGAIAGECICCGRVPVPVDAQNPNGNHKMSCVYGERHQTKITVPVEMLRFLGGNDE